MLRCYANQSVNHKSVISTDEYCQSSYATTAAIECRIEYSRKTVKNKEGQEVISEARAFTTTAVKPDDVITYDSKDWPVISVANMVNLKGEVKFDEVRM